MPLDPLSHSVCRSSLSRTLAPLLLLSCSAVSAFASYTCQDVVVTASQSSIRVGNSGTMQFSVSANGQPVTGGMWNIGSSFAYGGVDQNGVYYPPTEMPSPASASIYYNLPGCAPFATIALLNYAPQITSFEPATVVQLSTPIMIHGAYFVPGATVTVNGQPTAITFQDKFRIGFTLNLAAPSNKPISVVVTNPNPGSATASGSIGAVFPTFTSVTPATFVGGMNALTINGTGITDYATFSFDGKPLYPTKVNQGTYTASVFVAPWRTGSVPVSVNSIAGAPASSSQSIPIKATAIPFDIAARFSTQAAFGPRIDVVQRIQNIGLKAFIQEQLKQPAVVYIPPPPMSGRSQYLRAATSGNTLLRLRVATAIQTFIVNQAGNYEFGSYIPWEKKVEADALGNFRQLLTDCASDARMGLFLNLAGNNAPTDPSLHPNQNFARELMQLFSMGPSLLNDDGSLQLDSAGHPKPAYDQTTLLDLSRALTGWQQAPFVDPNYTFDNIDASQPLVPSDSVHDHGAKTLFGSVQLPAGQDIVTDRTAALDAIFNHPNVPPFVSRQLIQHLVKSNPSPAYIQRISKVFENNGKGVRGDLAAVVTAILLDKEARSGDKTAKSDDGFLEDPLLFQIFTVSTLGQAIVDGQPGYTAGLLGQSFWYPPSVNGFYANSHLIPGTSITSPEFTLWNNLSLVNRSQVLYGIIDGTINGFGNDYMRFDWLYNDFTNVPDLVDALNHLVYHGMMPASLKATIISTCAGLSTSDRHQQFAAAIFLALNSDSNNVQH